MTLWQHALIQPPTTAKPKSVLPMRLIHRNQLDAAIVHYRRALTFPCEPQAYGTSAWLWPAPTIPMKRSGGWTKPRRDPNNARTQANLGAALGVKKRWADAEKHLRRTIELDSNVAITHFDLGHVLLARENLDEAIAQFEAAVRLEPGNPSYNHSLAVALSRAHQFDRAIDEYQAALKIAPEFVPAQPDRQR